MFAQSLSFIRLSQTLGALLPLEVCGKNEFYPLFLHLPISPSNAYCQILHMPSDLRVRNHNLQELLKSQFKAICDKLTEADKENTAFAMEIILLEKIYEWAGYQNTINDREKGWFAYKLSAYQHYADHIRLEQHPTPQSWPDAPLDQCKKKVCLLKEFSLKLEVFDCDALEQNATAFI